MSQIKWDGVSEKEIRADSEIALEQSGENKKIKQFLAQSPLVDEWRNQIRIACKEIISEQNIDNINSGILYDFIAAKSLDSLPPTVIEEVTKRIQNYLSTQFEDHL